jgi:hypothetical protein
MIDALSALSSSCVGTCRGTGRKATVSSRISSVAWCMPSGSSPRTERAAKISTAMARAIICLLSPLPYNHHTHIERIWRTIFRWRLNDILPPHRMAEALFQIDRRIFLLRRCRSFQPQYFFHVAFTAALIPPALTIL